jgi:uncharacterized SAM-dependent methyltransferase
MVLDYAKNSMAVQTQDMPEAEVIHAIEQGLCGDPKKLPSWMLYDPAGDSLFQQIIQLPEYYPTRCEYEILNTHKEDLAHYFSEGQNPITLLNLVPVTEPKPNSWLTHCLRSTQRLPILPLIFQIMFWIN